MAKDSSGCFSWLINFKSSCNERNTWLKILYITDYPKQLPLSLAFKQFPEQQGSSLTWAKFRNRFRKRFYARRGATVDPITILNETGTSDMVVGKRRYKSNKVVPHNFSTRTDSDDLVDVEKAPPLAEADESLEKLVGQYVSCIINKAVESLRQPLLSNTDIMVNGADDTLSLSSSIISRIAETAVAESLTNIVLGTDIKYSVIDNGRSKTVKDFTGIFGSSVGVGGALDDVLSRANLSYNILKMFKFKHLEEAVIPFLPTSFFYEIR